MRFLTRYDGEVSEPLVGRQGSRVSMRVARASASLLSSHGILKEAGSGGAEAVGVALGLKGLRHFQGHRRGQTQSDVLQFSGPPI